MFKVLMNCYSPCPDDRSNEKKKEDTKKSQDENIDGIRMETDERPSDNSNDKGKPGTPPALLISTLILQNVELSESACKQPKRYL